MAKRMSMLIAMVAAVLLVGAPAVAFDGEKELHEAAKKEKEFTWYTAHYNTETAAAICNGFDKKYPGVACKHIRTTAQVAYQRLSQDQKAGIAQASIISSTDAQIPRYVLILSRRNGSASVHGSVRYLRSRKESSPISIPARSVSRDR